MKMKNKRIMSKLSCFFPLLLIGTTIWGQAPRSSELYRIIKEKDSLLFDIGFNTCDIAQFENLLSDHFEFYHDQGGITGSKTDFISGIRNGICNLDYKPVRQLTDSTLQVYPLMKNGILYGAIETGDHQFFAVNAGKPKYLTGIAKFTHLWLLENNEWKLSRGLSYDHKAVDEPVDEQQLFTDRNETNKWLQQKQIPALGIGYIENGTIKQTSVFGVLEKGRTAPENTIWNVASLTKPVTALVTLKLADKGKWNLDEPVYKYYTDPDLAGNPYLKKLTTRMILSHQTGFPNWRTDNKDGKLDFKFEPGTGYRYSGEGYEYLRKALENKFGKTLSQLADELVFAPLKMQNTYYSWNSKVDETRFAKWHREDGTLYPTGKSTTVNAADNLLTTVADYTKFMLYMMNGAGLSTKMQQEITATQVRVNDYKHFGLGWCIDENIDSRGRIAMVHGGDDIGVHTIVFIIPETQNGLLIFTNADNGTAAFADVLLHFLGKDGKGIFDIEMK